MKKEEAIGYQLRTTTNAFHRYLDHAIANKGIDDVTGFHGWVMHYLEKTPKEQVFQKDLEEDLAMQRSTASRVLQRMERNGYIRRESVPHDKRLKQVIPTKKLLEVNAIISKEIAQAENIMRNEISQEEMNQMLQTLYKIKANLYDALNEPILQNQPLTNLLKEESD